MPVNFTDSPSNGDTIIGGGLTYTYNSTTTRWESDAGGGLNTEEVQDVVGAMFTGNTETNIAATYDDGDGTLDLVVSSGFSTTVYATFALLIAATGMSTGDLAYVTATNKLYLYSVNGWFLIATVSNASPSAITGVSSAYTLATDATATVITAVSTDPEGFPLTWSWNVTTGSLTNGGGATATVSQSANVFTITPTTTEAYAGTFSITFTVTDGVNGAVNSIGAFTLEFLVDWTSTTQQAKIVASDAQSSDHFGSAVAIDGNTAIAGAYQESTYAGAVYVFTRSGTTWSQQQKLTASDATSYDDFGGGVVSDVIVGAAVGISGDTIVVGAFGEDAEGSNAGAAYVFTRSGTTWSQQQKLTASDAAAGDRFGVSVAIDGDTLIVGAYQDDLSANDAGSAYIFTRSGTTWSQQQKIPNPSPVYDDQFAYSVDISGDTVIAGVPMEETGGATSHGSAYIFTRSGTTWSQQQKIEGSNAGTGDNFGHAVAIDGDTVIAGAYLEDTSDTNAGSAYIFTRSGTTWSQQQMIQASDADFGDSFGFSVDVKSDTAVVGASKESTGYSSAGAAYVFTRSGTTWSQQKKVQASDKAANEYFGMAIGLSDDTFIAGVNPRYGTPEGQAYIFIGG
jgi:hypothetical protein